PAQVSSQSARSVREFGHARQEPDAAVGRSAQERRYRGAVGLCVDRRAVRSFIGSNWLNEVQAVAHTREGDIIPAFLEDFMQFVEAHGARIPIVGFGTMRLKEDAGAE